jgi:uncharacterized C2H2 Zn-finger protein
LQTHYERKKPCQPKQPVVIVCPLTIPVIDNDNQCKKCNKILCSKIFARKHETKCNGVGVLQCPTCMKLFSDRSSKSTHINNVKCKPLPETEREELNRLREMFKSGTNTPTTINNVNNNGDINNIHNTTNINVIQYNNYDKPYTDHITNTVMKGIYETSQRDPALILNETVRRIYKNDKHPENHVIKIGEKTALSRVYKDGKEIWLPMDGVIQSVMSSTGEFCADRIRDCHEEGVIIGDRARYVWQLMEILGTDDREDDCLNRSLYIQSIKSAFL